MNIRDYEVLFDTTLNDTMQPSWQSGVLRQRAKTTKAGEMLYVDSYPIWDTATSRAAKKRLGEFKRKGTTDAQRKLNIHNAKKKLILKINANFGEGDLLSTLTYPPHSQPKNEKEAVKNIRNFNRRFRRLCKRKELPEPRYVYVTEKTHSSKIGTCYHHHVILTGNGLTREEVENCWVSVHGGLCNTRRYQDQETCLTGYAKYMLKSLGASKSTDQQLSGKRSWNCSKNLLEPKVSVADKKISLRRVDQIARNVENPDTAKTIFEKLYPEYQFINIEVRASSFVAGAYIYVIMRKRQSKQRAKGLKGCSVSAKSL